ncbi:hypothetical protein BIV57_05515 [Mangrovactinospora gilvigrisea]|uniref:Thioredoxin domain-containing protein n=1 Tax=Mangrovactinospora gilvigrisea TaxID=1428644 RepID=A0A1J7BIJ9_9ACTN|nr:hypothetical protein BIV57_05515 [Mangrovactinospora gilvigrisea]
MLPSSTTPDRTRTRRPRALAVAAAAAAAAGALVLAGCSSSGSDSAATVSSHPSPKSVYRATALDTPWAKPDVTLTDTSGKPFNLRKDTAGRTTLLYFGYTHCPDECPTTMADIAVALQQLPKAEQQKVDVVFVTTDPAHDSKRTIRTWLDSFSSHFIGLTGDFKTIQGAARKVGIGVSPATVAKDGSITAVHGTQVVPFAPDGKAHVIFMNDQSTPQTFAHDLPLLINDVPPGGGSGKGSAGGAESQASAAAKGATHTPPKLTVKQQYVPKPAAGGMAAAYLTVANSGGTTDRLTRVTSQDATTVTMDTTSGGSMQEVTGFNVPAGGTLALARGGNHLMLQGLKKPLKEGGSITLRLTFAQSGPRTVTVPVESMTYRPGSAG